MVPKVSILLLTHNRTESLRLALESALKQTYRKPYEILVIDNSGNGSSFAKQNELFLKEICQKYRNVIYYRNEIDMGQQANWNRSVELCQSRWAGFLHDDGILFPDYLSKIMCHVENDSEANFAAIGILNQTIDRGGTVKGRFIKKLQTEIFGGRFRKLKIEDEFNLLLPQTQGLFIDCAKYLESGGLDHVFYDIGLVSKLTYLYGAAVFTEVLYYNTNPQDVFSFQRDALNGYVLLPYKIVEHICQTLNYSVAKTRRFASRAAILGEMIATRLGDADYLEMKKILGMKNFYNRPVSKLLASVIQKLNWLGILFQSHRGENRR